MKIEKWKKASKEEKVDEQVNLPKKRPEVVKIG